MANNIKNEYINNQDFLNALVSYKEQALEASINNKQKPKIPDYIGDRKSTRLNSSH